MGLIKEKYGKRTPARGSNHDKLYWAVLGQVCMRGGFPPSKVCREARIGGEELLVGRGGGVGNSQRARDQKGG